LAVFVEKRIEPARAVMSYVNETLARYVDEGVVRPI
jgi:hypothetical protein